jgi:hypothetical protein
MDWSERRKSNQGRLERGTREIRRKSGDYGITEDNGSKLPLGN